MARSCRCRDAARPVPFRAPEPGGPRGALAPTRQQKLHLMSPCWPGGLAWPAPAPAPATSPPTGHDVPAAGGRLAHPGVAFRTRRIASPALRHACAQRSGRPGRRTAGPERPARRPLARAPGPHVPRRITYHACMHSPHHLQGSKVQTLASFFLLDRSLHCTRKETRV